MVVQLMGLSLKGSTLMTKLLLKETIWFVIVISLLSILSACNPLGHDRDNCLDPDTTRTDCPKEEEP